MAPPELPIVVVPVPLAEKLAFWFKPDAMAIEPVVESPMVKGANVDVVAKVNGPFDFTLADSTTLAVANSRLPPGNVASANNRTGEVAEFKAEPLVWTLGRANSA